MTLLTQADTRPERKAATDDTYARKLREQGYAIAFEQQPGDWIPRALPQHRLPATARTASSQLPGTTVPMPATSDLQRSRVIAGLVKNPTG